MGYVRFINVLVRQAVESAPGFVDEEEFVVNIAVDKISVFNQGEDDDGNEVVFVRLVDGSSLCVVCDLKEFVTLLER